MSKELSEIAKVSARTGFFLFLGNSLSTVIMAVGSILIARLLGPENYGLYTVAMIVPSILVPLIDLGISPALTRFCAHYFARGQYRKVVVLINTGIIFKLVLSLIASVILLLFSETFATSILNRPSLGLFISVTLIYLIGQVVLTTLHAIFIGLDKTENSGLLMNIEAVTKLVVSPLLIFLGMGVIGAILGAGLGLLFAAGIGAAVLLLRISPSLHITDNEENVNSFQGLKMAVRYGMPLYLSSLIFSLVAQYRNFILARFASNTEIGNYSIAINFSVLITLLTYPIANSLFPAFSKLSIKENRNTVEKMFKLSVKYTSLLVVPASFAVAVLSNEAVDTLYGSQYGLAPSYLTVYILSFLCTGLGMAVVDGFFNGQGDTRATFRMNLIYLSISVPLAFILALLYGVQGLIASILVSQFLSVIYGLFLAHRKYAVTIDSISSLRTGAASIFSALLVYIFITFTPIPISIFNLAVGGCLYVMSFLVFAPVLRVIDKEDTRNLDGLVKGLALVYPIARRILKFEKKILSLGFAI